MGAEPGTAAAFLGAAASIAMDAIGSPRSDLMTMFRWVRQSVPLATVVLASAAPMALAQWGRQEPSSGRELFEWNGAVDREKQIVMRGSQVWTNDVGRTEPRAERARTYSSIPREDGRVVVRVVDGRGDVQVIQQPTSRNNYQTVVRVVDPRSGSDNYRLAAYWEGNGGGSSNGGVYSRDRDIPPGHDRDDNFPGRGRGRGHDRDRDGDDDGRNGNNGNNRNGNGSYGNGQYGSMMHWSGNVDDELEIRLQSGRVEYRTLRGAQPTSIRATNGNMSMPRTNAQISVVQNQGRGSVAVVQQPSSSNGYTTVLRVRDPQGGYGYYDFDLMWQ
jgi:hypothetical protein